MATPNKTQLVTRTQLSKWAKGCNLKGNYSSEELSTLYQLQKDDHYRPSWSELGKRSRHILVSDLLTVLPENKKNHVLPQTLIGQHGNKKEQLLYTLSLLSRPPAKNLDQEKISSHDNTSEDTKANHTDANNKDNSLSLGASLASNLTIADTAKLLLLSVEKPKITENKISGSSEKVPPTIPSVRTSTNRTNYPTQNPRQR